MVQEWKKREVENIVNILKNSRVIGIVDLHKLPSSQLQEIRKELKPGTRLKMVKKRLLKRAIEKSGIKELENLMDDSAEQIAIIYTDMNPFRLYKLLKKKQVPAFIKAGEKAPEDIVIPAGDTGIPAGPMIGVLNKIGARAAIQGQTIHIIQDSKVASKGDEISQELAGVLMQLNIKPVKIGLNLVKAYEDGVVYDREVLDLKPEEYEQKIITAYQHAFNLAYNTEYPIPQVLELLIVRAAMEARNLSINTGYPTKDTIEDILANAAAKARALESIVKQKS